MPQTPTRWILHQASRRQARRFRHFDATETCGFSRWMAFINKCKNSTLQANDLVVFRQALFVTEFFDRFENFQNLRQTTVGRAVRRSISPSCGCCSGLALPAMVVVISGFATEN